MVSCDSTDYGCGGGYLNNAWKYLETTGVVSDACFPYSSTGGTEDTCHTACTDGESFNKYKCVAGSTVNPQGVDEIKSEIY